MTDRPPVVLVFAGHDPSGGAGLVADREAIHSLGGYATTVVTAVTVQDSRGVNDYQSVEPELVHRQAQAILDDMPVAIIKTGMLGNAANAGVITELLQSRPELPCVIDPVLASGGGQTLADEQLVELYRQQLIPRALLATPNIAELARLTGITEDLDTAAGQLLASGCRQLLVTGADADTPTVVNRLYRPEQPLETVTVDRLPGRYHGSGCTLASACAVALAHGLEPVAAVAEAIDFTWHTLKHAHHLGRGQALPDRWYWTHKEE